MKLAWLSPRWPFPADDGAKVASVALLGALAEAGHEIAFAAFQRGDDPRLPFSPRIRVTARVEIPEETGFGRMARVLGNLFSALPVSVVPFSRGGLSWDLFREALGGEADALVVDGLHAFAAAPARCPWPMLYRSHNVEASLWEQAAERASVPKAWYFALQASRMRRFEAGLSTESRAVATISEEDAREIAARYPGARAVCVPVGFRFDAATPAPSGPLTLGWLGKMDWAPNREGLEWFLREIWPEAKRKRPDARLLVAGSGDDSWLTPALGASVERLGRVEDPAAFYARVHAAIAPIPFGSGTKIKVIEAARYGRAVFATPEAFRGSGLAPDCAALIASGKEEWIKAIADADAAELAPKGLLARARARELFDARAAAEKLLSLLR